MAIIKDNRLRNFLDSEFANSGSGDSSSRNNLESGTTFERRDGAEVVNTNNNADVNLNRSNEVFGTYVNGNFIVQGEGDFDREIDR